MILNITTQPTTTPSASFRNPHTVSVYAWSSAVSVTLCSKAKRFCATSRIRSTVLRSCLPHPTVVLALAALVLPAIFLHRFRQRWRTSIWQAFRFTSLVVVHRGYGLVLDRIQNAKLAMLVDKKHLLQEVFFSVRTREPVVTRSSCIA